MQIIKIKASDLKKAGKEKVDFIVVLYICP